MTTLRSALDSFLNEALRLGEIDQFEVVEAADLTLLRRELGSTSVPGYSRTHKVNPDGGSFIGFWVKAPAGVSVGVDLEFEKMDSSRNQLRRTAAEKLGLSKEASGKDVLEEWAVREACYKAISHFGERDPNFQDIRRSRPNEAQWTDPVGTLHQLKLRIAHFNEWVFVLAILA